MLTAHSIAEEAQLPASELLPVLLHAVADRVVVLDEHGIIANANDAWIQSAIENGASDVSRFGIGADYLGVCEQAARQGLQEARAAADGIHAVLTGAVESFVAEYACTLAEGHRYFRAIALPVRFPTRGVVVAHIDITLIRESERQRQRRGRLSKLLHEVTAAANQATSFENALRQTLAPISMAFGWPAAHVFLMPERELMLLPTKLWHFENHEGLFRLVSARAEPLDFNPATDRLAVRSLHLSHAPRAMLARELGLSHVVNLSVPAGSRPGGLIEFFSSTPVQLEEDEREALTNIAVHLGRVLERERHTSALLRSEAKFRSLFDSNVVPMYFWNAENKTILDANDALLSLLGFTREEMERGELRCTDITPEEQYCKTIAAIEELRQVGHCRPYEKNWVRRDGSILSVIVGGALLPGSRDAGLAVALDITELRRTASALRESERRYKLATSAAAISIWELDMSSDVVFTDGVLSELLGYPRHEQVSHKTWIDRIHPADRERALRHEQAVLASTERLPDGSTPIPEIEYRVLHRKGNVRWFLNRGLLLRDPEDRPYRAIGAIAHITEQKRAQHDLRFKQRQLSAAYARVQTLTGRLINAQENERRRVARELHDDLGQRVAALAISLAQIKRAFTGSEDLFAATERQVDDLAKSLRDVSHNLHSAVLEHAGLEAALRSLVEEYRCVSPLQVGLEMQPLPEAIPEQLSLAVYRIVQEGLRNVHKHSGASAATVHVRVSGSSLSIRVCDDGCGFDPKDHHTKNGLGLISVQERARLLGGKAWVYSFRGRGTHLSAILPLQQGERHEAA